MEVAAHMEVNTSVSNKRKRLHSGDASILLQSSRDDPRANQCPVSAASWSENSVSSTKMCEDLDKITENSLGLMNLSMTECPTLGLKADEISLANHGGFSNQKAEKLMESSETKRKKAEEMMESSETKRKKGEEMMESSETKRRKASFSISSTAVAKMPSAEEMEEFFSAAEKQEQKRFAEKYNFDIVKDVPLEGRYHWVCLKP